MRNGYLSALAFLPILAIALSHPNPASAQIVIERSVIGGGPTVALSGTTVIAATVGQGVVDLTTQDPLGVYQGFWGPAVLTSLSVDSPPTRNTATSLDLSSVYPNPSSTRTTAWISLSGSAHVVATLHDGLGRELLRPIDDLREAGSHKITIDGSSFSSGVYYLRVSADGVTRTTPVIIEQ